MVDLAHEEQHGAVRRGTSRPFSRFCRLLGGRRDEETAINGKWRKGPGMELFNAIEKALGSVPLIAEDLGVQTDEVKELLSRKAVSRACAC